MCPNMSDHCLQEHTLVNTNSASKSISTLPQSQPPWWSPNTLDCSLYIHLKLHSKSPLASPAIWYGDRYVDRCSDCLILWYVDPLMRIPADYICFIIVYNWVVTTITMCISGNLTYFPVVYMQRYSDACELHFWVWLRMLPVLRYPCRFDADAPNNTRRLLHLSSQLQVSLPMPPGVGECNCIGSFCPRI